MAFEFKSENELFEIDSQRMFDVIKNFPTQVEDACKIGEIAPVFKNTEDLPSNFAVLGMGGSAIGGDILRSYSQATKGADHLNFTINRTYDLPGFINENYAVISSSYSGNTEETLSGFDQAKERTKHLIAVSTGGKLTENAKEAGVPVVSIPAGFQPRAALGYSFFPTLHLMMKSGAYKEEAVKETNAAIEELIPLLKRRSEEYSQLNENNFAIQLAEKLFNKIPVIYSSNERLDTTNIRWRGQIQENAKHACFGNFLPEMNHNEINGWTFPQAIQENGISIFLEDQDDNPRVKIRFDAFCEILVEKGYEVVRLEGEGEHLLTRIFDLIYLADWVSYYLAMLNKVDPTPIPLINRLKDILDKK